MKTRNTKKTQTAILESFDKSETKHVTDIARRIGIHPSTIHWHLRNDGEFRRNFLEKKRSHITNVLVNA